MRLKPSTFLLILLVGAFALRLGAVAILRDLHVGPTGGDSCDDVEFNHLALRVAAGQGYVGDQGQPTSFRAPGWPLFLAGLYRLIGTDPLPVYLVLCLLGALACVLTYLVAGELMTEGLARLAGVLAAVYPAHISFAAEFVSESLFVTCLALGTWLFLLALRRESGVLVVLTGLVLSWATLTRPFALLLWPVFLGVLIANRRHALRSAVVPALAFTVAFFACVLPWTVRNQRVHGHLVLIATNGGSTFYGGNNGRMVSEIRLLGNWLSTTELPHRDWIEATKTGYEHDQMEWRLGLDWVREHPGAAALLCVFKVARLIFWLPEFPVGSRFLLGRLIGYLPFLVLILLGALTCARQRRYWTLPWLVVHGIMLATLVTALIFWGSPRFRDANVPCLMAYAALGLGQVLQRFRRDCPDEAQPESGSGYRWTGSVRQIPEVSTT
jgi:4-amino-4-deoxy-L-arabinose transferase-like glycosyltransferase